MLHFTSTRTIKPFVAHSSNVNCLALGRKSAGVLVTGGEDALINVWRLGRPSALLNLTGHASPITCVDFDHREEMVTGGSFGGSIKVFDLSAHGKVVRTYQGHHTAVTSIDHHPYGGHVVSGSTDSTVRLWDLRRKNCRSTFKGHAGAVTCVRFSPDGSQVASGSDDGRIKIWDLNAGKLLQEFQHKGVRSIEYHPNDFLMCSIGKDRCIKIWDVDQMNLVETSTKQQSNSSCIRFDRNGEGLLTTTDTALKSWKWEPMRVVDTLSSKAWGDNVKDMRVTHSRQTQVVVCASTDSFVSAWVINLGDENEREEEGHKEQDDSTKNVRDSTRETREIRETRESPSKRNSPATSSVGGKQNESRRRSSPSTPKVEMPKTTPMERTPPRRQRQQQQPQQRIEEEERKEEERRRRGRRTPEADNKKKERRKKTPESDARNTTASTKSNSNSTTTTTSTSTSTPESIGSTTSSSSSHKNIRPSHSPVTSPAPSPTNSPRRISSSTAITQQHQQHQQKSRHQSSSPPTSEHETKQGFDAATSMGSSFLGLNAPGNKNTNQSPFTNGNSIPRSNSPIALPASKYEEEEEEEDNNNQDNQDNQEDVMVKELCQQGQTFRDHMSGRLREMRVVTSLWSGSARSGGKDALSHVQKTYRDDPSIALDFIINTKLDGGAFDLLSCVTLFPLLSNLLNKFNKEEEHALGLIDAVQTLYRGFGEVICHNAKGGKSNLENGGDVGIFGAMGGKDRRRQQHNPFARDVDIGSEERVHRATACYESLTKIATQISILMQDTTFTQVQRSAKELHRLFRKKGIGRS